jgi:hypothetical protein
MAAERLVHDHNDPRLSEAYERARGRRCLWEAEERRLAGLLAKREAEQMGRSSDV